MKKTIKIAMWVVLLLYTVFTLWLLFIRDRGASSLSVSEHFRQYSNLVPFSTVIHDIKAIAQGNNAALYIRNFFGNIMLLFPFGLLLPFITDKFKSALRILGLFAAIIMTVELAQLLLRVGSVDTDDLILNVMGGMAGFGVYTSLIYKN